MKQNNMNGESRAELLKLDVERCIDRKNRVVKTLDKKIADIEDKVWKTKKQASRLEEQLRRLRIRREDEEIKCFKEIKRIHTEVSRLTTRNQTKPDEYY